MCPWMPPNPFSTTISHLVFIAVSWTRLTLALRDRAQTAVEPDEPARWNKPAWTWIVPKKGFIRKHKPRNQIRLIIRGPVSPYIFIYRGHFDTWAQVISWGWWCWTSNWLRGATTYPEQKRQMQRKKLKIETPLFKSTTLRIIRSS